MSEDKKRELRSQGFIILQIWQIIIFIIIAVFSAGAGWMAYAKAVDNLDKRVVKVEGWMISHEKEQIVSVQYRNQKLTEQGWMLEDICDKLHIPLRHTDPNIK
jgi:uncharacterized ion transporter superfamily protein YfcC